jgi:hypothetical protein
MANNERLRALDLVREAKKAAVEALSLIRTAAEAKPLEGLLNCLEKIEGDLIVAALEAKLSELQGLNGQLVAINSRIDQNVEELQSVAQKVNLAAKAIGVVVDVTGKIASAV